MQGAFRRTSINKLWVCKFPSSPASADRSRGSKESKWRPIITKRLFRYTSDHLNRIHETMFQYHSKSNQNPKVAGFDYRLEGSAADAIVLSGLHSFCPPPPPFALPFFHPRMCSCIVVSWTKQQIVVGCYIGPSHEPGPKNSSPSHSHVFSFLPFNFSVRL